MRARDIELAIEIRTRLPGQSAVERVLRMIQCGEVIVMKLLSGKRCIKPILIPEIARLQRTSVGLIPLITLRRGNPTRGESSRQIEDIGIVLILCRRLAAKIDSGANLCIPHCQNDDCGDFERSQPPSPREVRRDGSSTTKLVHPQVS